MGFFAFLPECRSLSLQARRTGPAAVESAADTLSPHARRAGTGVCRASLGAPWPVFSGFPGMGQEGSHADSCRPLPGSRFTEGRVSAPLGVGFCPHTPGSPELGRAPEGGAWTRPSLILGQCPAAVGKMLFILYAPGLQVLPRKVSLDPRAPSGHTVPTGCRSRGSLLSVPFPQRPGRAPHRPRAPAPSSPKAHPLRAPTCWLPTGVPGLRASSGVCWRLGAPFSLAGSWPSLHPSSPTVGPV